MYSVTLDKKFAGTAEGGEQIRLRKIAITRQEVAGLFNGSIKNRGNIVKGKVAGQPTCNGQIFQRVYKNERNLKKRRMHGIRAR